MASQNVMQVDLRICSSPDIRRCLQSMIPDNISTTDEDMEDSDIDSLGSPSQGAVPAACTWQQYYGHSDFPARECVDFLLHIGYLKNYEWNDFRTLPLEHIQDTVQDAQQVLDWYRNQVGGGSMLSHAFNQQARTMMDARTQQRFHLQQIKLFERAEQDRMLFEKSQEVLRRKQQAHEESRPGDCDMEGLLVFFKRLFFCSPGCIELEVVSPCDFGTTLDTLQRVLQIPLVSDCPLEALMSKVFEMSTLHGFKILAKSSRASRPSLARKISFSNLAELVVPHPQHAAQLVPQMPEEKQEESEEEPAETSLVGTPEASQSACRVEALLGSRTPLRGRDQQLPATKRLELLTTTLRHLLEWWPVSSTSRAKKASMDEITSAIGLSERNKNLQDSLSSLREDPEMCKLLAQDVLDKVPRLQHGAPGKRCQRSPLETSDRSGQKAKKRSSLGTG